MAATALTLAQHHYNGPRLVVDLADVFTIEMGYDKLVASAMERHRFPGWELQFMKVRQREIDVCELNVTILVQEF